MDKKLILLLVLILFTGFAGIIIYQNSTSEEETVDNQDVNTARDESSIEEEEEDTNVTYTDISVGEAKNMLDKEPSIIILDVSPNYDAGHLPNSINYYVGDGSLDEAIPSLDKSKTYLVYCHVDSAAIQGAEKLIDAGFETVYRLEGNYSGWVEAGYPIEIFLNKVGDIEGTVKATRSFYDGKFTHTVEAKITNPPDGKFYEGWLVKSDPDTEFFSTGELMKTDGVYKLEYMAAEDKSDFNEVVITVETESQGLDGNPEEHIFEGVF